MNNIKIPDSGNLLALNDAGDNRFKLRFRALIGSGWQCQLLEGDITKIAPPHDVNVQCVIEGQLTQFKATVLKSEGHGKTLLLGKIDLLRARPLRGSDRICVPLPASVGFTDVTVDREDGRVKKAYLRRTNNLIVNISDTGVLLVTKKALPAELKEMVLYTSFTFEAGVIQDVLLRGDLVRRCASTHSDYFYGYGIAFKELLPYCEERLASFLRLQLARSAPAAASRIHVTEQYRLRETTP